MTTMPNPVLKELTSVRANGQTATSKAPPPPGDAGAAPPSPLPDLAALTDETLAALVEQGQAEIARRKKQAEDQFLDMVAKTARTLGLSPTRIAAAISNKSQRQSSGHDRDGRHDVKPVYRDPVSGATWSGRGAPPAWIELGDEINPNTGKPLPLRKFWLSEQEK